MLNEHVCHAIMKGASPRPAAQSRTAGPSPVALSMTANSLFRCPVVFRPRLSVRSIEVTTFVLPSFLMLSY